MAGQWLVHGWLLVDKWLANYMRVCLKQKTMPNVGILLGLGRIPSVTVKWQMIQLGKTTRRYTQPEAWSTHESTHAIHHDEPWRHSLPLARKQRSPALGFPTLAWSCQRWSQPSSRCVTGSSRRPPGGSGGPPWFRFAVQGGVSYVRIVGL